MESNSKRVRKGRVVITNVEEAEPLAFPGVAGVTARGTIQTRRAIDGPDRPLLLWTHALAPGAELAFESPSTGHLLYVWSGSATFDEKPAPREVAIVVEHGGRGTLRAGPGGATIAHFFPRPGAVASERAGGGSHVLAGEPIENPHSEIAFTVWADSTCPTCTFWLHQNHYPNPSPQAGAHFHTADEILLVTQGGVVLGQRTFGAGTAIAVDARTIYSFGILSDGCVLLNFRAVPSCVTKVGRKNEPLHAEIPEDRLIRDPQLQAFAIRGAAPADEYRASGLGLEEP